MFSQEGHLSLQAIYLLINEHKSAIPDFKFHLSAVDLKPFGKIESDTDYTTL